MNLGIVYGFSAFFLWGVSPIYWKALLGVPPLEILAHRMVWSLLFVALIITWNRGWSKIRQVIKSPRLLLTLCLSTLLVGGNWLGYIWGVNNGHIVECSLGYFLTPLINVMLGVFFLGERLRRWQIVSFLLATLGLLIRTWQYGYLPSLSLFIAITFAFYGLVRKRIPVDSITALGIETAIMLIPAGLYLSSLEWNHAGALGHSSLTTTLLLLGSGVITSVPLLMFTEAARRIQLSTLGILQYLAPTGQFLLGVILYQEPFSTGQLIGFCAIWAALAMFTVEGILHNRRASRLLTGSSED